LKTLIDNIVTYLRAAIGGDLSAKIVMKGFDDTEPDQVPIERYPYVMVDDGGERVEADTAGRTQTRIYTVSLFMAVISGDVEKSLDDILDLANEVKTLFETEANRQKDGHRWGVNINPVAGKLDNNKFFRGRFVDVDFEELEDNYGEY
jgi:hypothetical protein